MGQKCTICPTLWCDVSCLTRWYGAGVRCRADCKKSLQNYICIGRHMMPMDGSLLAAKPYLKSKVQAKGWLIVHTKPGGITLYWHFNHVCNSDHLYEKMKMPLVWGRCGQSPQSGVKSGSLDCFSSDLTIYDPITWKQFHLQPHPTPPPSPPTPCPLLKFSLLVKT